MTRFNAGSAMTLGGLILSLTLNLFVCPGLLGNGLVQGVDPDSVTGPQIMLQRGDKFPANVTLNWLCQSGNNVQLSTPYNLSPSADHGSYTLAFIDPSDISAMAVFQAFVMIDNIFDKSRSEAVKQHRSGVPNWILVTGSDPGTTQQAPIYILESLAHNISLMSDPGLAFSRQYGWTRGNEIVSHYIFVANGLVSSAKAFDSHSNSDKVLEDWREWDIDREYGQDEQNRERASLLTGLRWFHSIMDVSRRSNSKDRDQEEQREQKWEL